VSAHRVVIVGGGFGGLQAARGLRRADVEITLIDRRNFHLFQPLSYQVATVEMAGQIAELACDTMRNDFRTADPGSGRILLIEAADRVLTGFPPSLSAKAERSLRTPDVTPVLGSTVVDVDETGVTIADADDATRRIPARTIVWAAGVTASRLASELAAVTGPEQDLRYHRALQSADRPRAHRL
jgi:NADH dehydrogenase